MTKLASVLAIAGMALLSSCGGEETPPSITLDTNAMTVAPGEEVTVTATFAEEDKKLAELTVTESTDMGGAATVELDGSSNNYVYTGTVPANAGGTTITVTFTVKDKKDNEGSVDLVLTVETPFANETTTSIVNNIHGPSAGAWDMVADQAKLKDDADADKDIVDQTDANTGDFLAGGWAAGNGTMFVVANSYDYANATQESAVSAYAAGTATATLSNDDLAVDNVIIAKLRGGDDYSVIKITEVFDDGTNGGTGNNTDYRKFTYKK